MQYGRAGIAVTQPNLHTTRTEHESNGGLVTSEVLSNGITETRAYRTDNLLLKISFAPCQLAWQVQEFLELANLTYRDFASSDPLDAFSSQRVGTCGHWAGSRANSKTWAPVSQAHKGAGKLVGYEEASSLTFSWDFDNKMKSSDIDANGSANVTFKYDALGRRVPRTRGSSAVVYFQALSKR